MYPSLINIKEQQSKSGEIVIEENRHRNKKSKSDHEKIKDYIQNRFTDSLYYLIVIRSSITIDEETLTINNQMDTVKGILEFGAKRNTGEILDDY